ncbi:MAG: carboxypeptidase-like regulatory domain-containing protein [Candidatus Angelobacter sp.]
MQISFQRAVLVGCILLQAVGTSYGDTCYKYHKRAPVKSVCGRTSNPLGERPGGVELTLVDESGAVRFTAKVDGKGRFAFGPIPKGDYTLSSNAPGYTTVERQLRVIREGEKNCKPRIEVRLGFRSCDGGTYVKGFDRKSDLFDQD